MFFILSKLLYFILQPLNWLIGLPIFAILTKNARRKRRILRGCFALLVIITNPFLGNRVFHAWEAEEVSMSALKDTFDIGIVLGGYTKGGLYPENRLHFSTAANRLTDAVQLYKRGYIKKLLISGGDGKLLGKTYPESELAKQFLLDMGVKPEDILVDYQSRNTHENALYSKQLLDKQGLTNGKLLVITSAFHIPRAIGCFKKVGINASPFPAHFIAERLSFEPSAWLTPDPEVLKNWEIVLKEWVGYCVYKLQGYI
ncbi:MAG: YdcF family protein [Saprospiraceae bacterium]|nr:YdcF family protein [Saprospiraceae bacterium]